jgi:hypothetical protein
MVRPARCLRYNFCARQGAGIIRLFHSAIYLRKKRPNILVMMGDDIGLFNPSLT